MIPQGPELAERPFHHKALALHRPGLQNWTLEVAARNFIAVIEDDSSLQAALEALLRSLGYRAAGFSSAEAFLQSRDPETVDCVITDVQMGGMSGIELKRRLSALRSDIPVIMITARTETALLERARSSGAFCLLSKPFEAGRLADCLERALAVRPRLPGATAAGGDTKV